MECPPAFARSRTLFAIGLLLFLPASSLAQAAAGVVPPAGASQSADQGARLFLGQTRFANGGPPCGSCHRLSALPFPNGGTVGPDLSPAYRTLGEEGTDVTLQTLFFPTMMPLYEKRPLVGDEQQALKALLKQAAPPIADNRATAALAGIAGLGFLVLMATAWLAWRHRGRAGSTPTT
jgi:hypothetical protein